MTAERDPMTLNESSAPALGVEERSDEAPRQLAVHLERGRRATGRHHPESVGDLPAARGRFLHLPGRCAPANPRSAPPRSAITLSATPQPRPIMPAYSERGVRRNPYSYRNWEPRVGNHPRPPGRTTRFPRGQQRCPLSGFRPAIVSASVPRPRRASPAFASVAFLASGYAFERSPAFMCQSDRLPRTGATCSPSSCSSRAFLASPERCLPTVFATRPRPGRAGRMPAPFGQPALLGHRQGHSRPAALHFFRPPGIRAVSDRRDDVVVRGPIP